MTTTTTAAIVAYSVPVAVFVDLDTGEVTRVVVEDEAMSDPLSAFPDDGDQLTSDQRERAVDIAESAEWPSWDIGY
jgi:hypothetical protein